MVVSCCDDDDDQDICLLSGGGTCCASTSNPVTSAWKTLQDLWNYHYDDGFAFLRNMEEAVLPPGEKPLEIPILKIFTGPLVSAGVALPGIIINLLSGVILVPLVMFSVLFELSAHSFNVICSNSEDDDDDDICSNPFAMFLMLPLILVGWCMFVAILPLYHFVGVPTYMGLTSAYVSIGTDSFAAGIVRVSRFWPNRTICWLALPSKGAMVSGSLSRCVVERMKRLSQSTIFGQFC